eukprot:gene28972-25939_t
MVMVMWDAEKYRPVSEATEVGAIVAQLPRPRKDDGSFAETKYELNLADRRNRRQADGSEMPFAVSDTGEVTVVNPLDSETNSEFDLTSVATVGQDDAGRNTPDTFVADLTISVTTEPCPDGMSSQTGTMPCELDATTENPTTTSTTTTTTPTASTTPIIRTTPTTRTTPVTNTTPTSTTAATASTTTTAAASTTTPAAAATTSKVAATTTTVTATTSTVAATTTT